MLNNVFLVSLLRLLSACLLVFTLDAQAHELRPTVAEVSYSEEQGVLIALRINLEAIVAGIGPEHDDTEDAPQAELYRQLRELDGNDLQARFAAMQTQFLQKLSIVNAKGVVLDVVLDSAQIPPAGDTRLPRDTMLTLMVPDNSVKYGMAWQWDEQLGPLIIRTALDVQDYSQYLQPGQQSRVFNVLGDNEQTAGRLFLDYILIGIEHIVPKGIDHILFVIGLFLLAPAFKPVVLQVSAFTLAHTVTLGLGVSGYLALPASVVEPLIALSITAICVENLLKTRVSRLRIVLVFLFGLLHGLGFAGVLGEIGLPKGEFFRALLAFNIGVEIGQLIVLLACFAFVGWWFRHKPWYRKFITAPASVILGATGLFWFFQRIGAIG